VIRSFYAGGRVSDLWGGEHTPCYNDKNFETAVPRSYARVSGIKGSNLAPSVREAYKGDLPDDMLFYSTTDEADYRAVQWSAPEPLEGFKPLTDLIVECLNNVGFARLHPNFESMVPGCKSCNDIMTLESTASHFLVREVISPKPLVPLECILSIALAGSKINDLSFKDLNDSSCRWDPSESSRGGHPKDFTYQACLAYYIHRCTPPRPNNSLFSKNKNKNNASLHSINAALSFIVLEIACLQYERYKGRQGGTERRSKATYRYRGCAEMYLSYIFWILLMNDNMQGEKIGKTGNHCKWDFPVFHRYMFLDFIKVLVLKPEFAGDYEILDIVSGGNMLFTKDGEGGGIMLGRPIKEPAVIIGDMCQSISLFYKRVVKPIFSRHIAAQQPMHELIESDNDDGNDGDNDDSIIEQQEKLYSDQILCYNMIVDEKSLNNIMHLVDKGIVGDISTFIHSAGIHGVLSRWLTLLDMVPKRVFNLVRDFMDDETCKEYRNIQSSMRPDEFQPTISKEAAETIYEMCNALELPSEPNSQEELELLRIGFKCSEMKAVERLAMLGAFKKEDEDKKLT
jgi:hypothetical protein